MLDHNYKEWVQGNIDFNKSQDLKGTPNDFESFNRIYKKEKFYDL